jgi:hypothetical protein
MSQANRFYELEISVLTLGLMDPGLEFLEAEVQRLGK